MTYLRDVLIRCPDIDLADRLNALDGLKRSLCWQCLERCDRYTDQIIEAARAAGEAVP